MFPDCPAHGTFWPDFPATIPEIVKEHFPMTDTVAELDQAPGTAEKIIRLAILGVIPMLYVAAPRYTRHILATLNMRTLRTPENRAFFDAHRRWSDDDAARVDEVVGALRERVDADDWTGLSDMLAALDTSRETLAQSPHRLIDVAFDALRHGLAEVVYPPTVCNPSFYYLIPDEVLAKVEGASQARPDDPWLTALLAQIHIDRGWCARGGGWSHEVTEEGWRGLMESFETAERLLRRFAPEEVRSPFYARVRFQLLATANPENGLDTAREVYRDWSDLDTGNPVPHRTYAFHALPRWFGTWPEFEKEARAAAERTRHTMGASAYALFYLQAFAYDEDQALCYIDTDFFAEALEDLIARDANPSGRAVEAAMRIASVVEPHAQTIIGDLLGFLSNSRRDALRPLIRHLFETHVTHLPTKPKSKAEAELIDLISSVYQPEIRAGHSLSFTPEGVRMVPPEG